MVLTWSLYTVYTQGAQNKLIFALQPAVSKIEAIGGHLGFGDLEISNWSNWPKFTSM